jgi:hypothetical protein
MDKYAIYVVETTAELRDAQICSILDLEYEPQLGINSNFIGFTDKVKFLNWYDNPKYVKTWNTQEEAVSFLTFIMEKANKYYMTFKDPFYPIRNTKGDWKNFSFIVTKYDYNELCKKTANTTAHSE